MEQPLPELYDSHPAMSERDFSLLRSFIKEECGINISPSKRVMLTLRLQKRLRALNLGSFRQYIDFIATKTGRSQEIVSMLDVVSTNKTDFFREFSHFDYLSCEALPQLVAAKGNGKVNVWSAGCSSGEEPYTIAMVMSEFAESNPDFRFGITASDISMKALRVAVRAVYPDSVAENIPSPLKRKYTLRGRGPNKGFHRVAPEIRNKVEFKRLNLMDEDYGFKDPLHIIFCRNVIIYFDRDTQAELFRKFHGLLYPGGYLFLGHSETLEEKSTGFLRAAPTVYRKPK